MYESHAIQYRSSSKITKLMETGWEESLMEEGEGDEPESLAPLVPRIARLWSLPAHADVTSLDAGGWRLQEWRVSDRREALHTCAHYQGT